MAYEKHETAAEHNFAHAMIAGAGLLTLTLILAVAATFVHG